MADNDMNYLVLGKNFIYAFSFCWFISLDTNGFCHKPKTCKEQCCTVQLLPQKPYQNVNGTAKSKILRTKIIKVLWESLPLYFSLNKLEANKSNS